VFDACGQQPNLSGRTPFAETAVATLKLLLASMADRPQAAVSAGTDG
jgi:hypothetical protein